MYPLSRRWIITGLIISVLPLSACSKPEASAAHTEHPSQVDKIEGSEHSRVTLTERAAERIGLETVSVREQELDGSLRRVVPYSSLIYDPKGGTWVYTSPQPRTFVRQQVEVESIDGDQVLLVDGPPVGTEIASVGVAEIYGAETGVGH